MAGHSRVPVIERLSSSLGLRDEGPNRALAEELAREQDTRSTGELLALGAHERAAVRRDAAKTLAHLAGIAPALVASHLDALAAMVASGEGVVAWAAMEALSRAAPLDTAAAFKFFDIIVTASRGESVIARDHAVRLLVLFAADSRRRARVLPALAEILRTCPVLQFPTYVELTLAVVPRAQRAEFVELVRERLPQVTRPSASRRIEKALTRAESAR